MPERIVVLLAPPPDPGLAERLAGRSDADVETPGPSVWRDALRRAQILVTRTSHTVDGELLEAAPRLRMLVQASAGIDNIDVRAAAARGVQVMQVDPGNAPAVAELTLMSLIALARGARDHWNEVASGSWPDRDRIADRQLDGACLGVVGLGRIGSLVARLARGFGMRVLAVDPYVPEERFARFGAERAETLEGMLPAAEFLTLHCPLTEETRNMLDGPRLDRLPRGAFLVNTARGGIVDEEALLDRLDSGRIAGAALDVFRSEPAPDRRLARHPAVLPTPHIAGHTVESRAQRLENVAGAVARALDALAGPRS